MGFGAKHQAYHCVCVLGVIADNHLKKQNPHRLFDGGVCRCCVKIVLLQPIYLVARVVAVVAAAGSVERVVEAHMHTARVVDGVFA